MGKVTWIAPLAGLALMLGLGQLSRAADEAPASKATVTVTVQDKEGKAVEGFRVDLYLPETDRKHPAHAVANGTSDASGKAVLANVPDGKYSVSASLVDHVGGAARVKVEGGKDVSVTVTLGENLAGTWVTVLVQDKDGKAVEGAHVRLVRLGRPPHPDTRTTDASGKAVYGSVSDGEYTVAAYRSENQKIVEGGEASVKVEGSKDASVTVTLKEKKKED
jgi:hypothetical protein